MVAPSVSTLVRGAFGARYTSASRFLLFVTFFPASPFAVNLSFELAESIQICIAPKPYSPAVAYAQLGGLELFRHNPAVQGHYRNSRCFGGLLCIKGLCHNCDIYSTFKVGCKVLVSRIAHSHLTVS